MRATYPLVFLDFGRCYSAAATDSLPEMEAMFLIVTQDLHVLENAKDFIRLADERGKGPDRIKVLLNRINARQKPDLDALETYLGIRPAGVFSDDTEALYEVWSEGRLLGGDSELGRQLRELTKSLVAPPAEESAGRGPEAKVSQPKPGAAATISPAAGGIGRFFSFMRKSMA
jgi:Flp pilus assembly CpaE family ATPase